MSKLITLAEHETTVRQLANGQQLPVSRMQSRVIREQLLRL